jgi:amino acid transporter
LTFIVSCVLVFFGTTKAFSLLVSFASFGFILSYYLPIAGLAYRRLRGSIDLSGTWGERWIGLVTAVAVIWLTAEIVNLVWPRAVTGDWYRNWGVLIMTGVLGIAGGLLCWRVLRPGTPSAAPPVPASPVPGSPVPGSTVPADEAP